MQQKSAVQSHWRHRVHRIGFLRLYLGPAIQAFPVRPAQGGFSSCSNGKAALEKRAIQFHRNPFGSSDSDIYESYLHRSYGCLFHSVAGPQRIEPANTRSEGATRKPVMASPPPAPKSPLRAPASGFRLAIPVKPMLKCSIRFDGRMQRYAFPV